MKRVIQLLLAFSLTTQVFAKDPIDDALNAAKRKLFNYKILNLYKAALNCNPLEIDDKSGLTVREWMEIKPELPDGKMLTHFISIARKARTYAQPKVGSDKVKHCFAGCFIRKNLDLHSARMAGWLKELGDASDCSTNTHFEQADYFATHAGAIAGKKNNCEDFCQRDDIRNSTADIMLEIATNEN